MLYKYRDLKDFQRFVDIVLKGRLYAALYTELNDPMEGHYIYQTNNIDKYIREQIKGEKQRYRICSLSQDPINDLMLSHYADGHRGVVIGVEIDSNKYDVIQVRYDGPHRFNNNFNDSTVKEILSHKHEVWAYEKEVRVFEHNNKMYIDADIQSIMLGCKMSNQDVSLIRGLIKRINPKIRVSRDERRFDD